MAAPEVRCGQRHRSNTSGDIEGYDQSQTNDQTNDQSQTEQEQTVQIYPPEDIHFLSAIMTLQDNRLGSSIGYMCFALLIVLLQLVASMCLIVTMGNLNVLCSEHGECGRAKWCTATAHPRGIQVGAGRCLYCVADDHDLCWLNATAKNSELWATGQDGFKLATRSSLPRKVGYQLSAHDHEAMCYNCIGMAGADRGTPKEIVVMNLEMGVREWLVYTFISLTASMLIAKEANDLYKNIIVLHRSLPTHWLSALNVGHPTSEPPGEGFVLAYLPELMLKEFAGQRAIWKAKHLCLQALQDLRAGLLGNVLINVPCFTILDRSDPVNILVNALATFFILEVDDLFFNLAPAENHPVRAWTTQPLHMDAEDVKRMQKVKLAFFWTSLLTLTLLKPLGDAFGTAYLYVPALCLNACSLTSELLLCHSLRSRFKVALRWFIFGFVCYWSINVVLIAVLPVVW